MAKRSKPRKKTGTGASSPANDAIKGASPLQKKMLEAMCDRIDSEDLGFFDSGLLLKMAKNHAELAKSREKGKSKFRIYTHETKGRARSKTIIDIVSDDAAFLVDSTVSEINRQNHLIHLLIHPILYAKYESETLKDITSLRDEKLQRQSHIHVQINETLSDDAIKALKAGLEAALGDVFIVNRDWQPMLQKLKQARDELAAAKTGSPRAEVEQYSAFLDYLYNNNFTLLGYREYVFSEKDGKVKARHADGLGLLSPGIKPAYLNDKDEALPRSLQKLRRKLPAVTVAKTRRLSTVHRLVPMDTITVKTFDENGRVTGEKLFLGLFTSVTYSRSVSDVPYLREKVEAAVEKSDFIQGSHNRKAMRHILEKYPRDDLFQIEPDELYKTVLDILRLQERQRIALFMRRDPFGHYYSCLVYVPKDRFGTKLRKRLQTVLEQELGGECLNFYTTMDDSVFARVSFIISVDRENVKALDHAAIEKKLQETGKTWAEQLHDALIDSMIDDARITDLSRRYSDAFPLGYTAAYTARQGVLDIVKIERALATKGIVLDLYRPNDTGLRQLRLKVYNPGAPLTLSDVMPILENLGMRAISELPFQITPVGAAESVWIHDFLLETDSEDEAKCAISVKEKFETAFTKTWYNEMESDGLNRLVIGAGLDWREITILRAYVRYLRQIGFAFSRPYIQRALTQNPHISRLIVDLFMALHDPGQVTKQKTASHKIIAAIETALEKVESLDQDRIMRTMKTLVEASLRTNFFQEAPGGGPKPYLSIKFDSALVPDLPDPKPYREIFVYSPRVEGVHLRGGPIARGGLRWSDRHEDFRTEILGLMKAQMVKNAVIVPVGAKGGFVVKTATKDRAEYRNEGIECYRTFIRGLLDITDNLKGGKVIPPKNTVRRDGDDPYLVVAADKGTATFSDIANAISEEYNHWLGDAFASGGSAGYDHKEMGITARGAWESVKMHFRQLNHNTQTQPFEVVGVGDMGGDVFGNGLLQSDKVKLIGAFNHIHIFCDPDPDPAVSYKERKRLFDNVLGWDEYDVKKLSRGGRIYRRDEKSLTLTPEIKKRLDIAQDKVAPNDLIRAMLKARTDLLFFGGIGTYVKSAHQTHADVGDKANDALRINGNEVRASVVGEGANLAMTQLARIEYAQRGGRINTDFLDNSAGVDTSDHEVNIKILLAAVMSGKSARLDLESRNKLLEKMTDEVAAAVLRDNYQQAQAVSLAELQASETLQLQEEFIQDMERDYGFNRALEGLPDRDTVAARLAAGKGLTRPELCILLSYAKIRFTQDLLASDVPDDPLMQDWLFDYFPAVLGKNYREEILNHRLRRELIATMMSNSLVNRMGPTFIKSRMKKTGAGAADIAKAYIIVRDAFGLRALWDQIEALDNKVPADVQLRAMREISHLAGYAVTWFLTRLGRDPDMSGDAVSFGKGIEALRKGLPALNIGEMSAGIKQRAAAMQKDGLPPALAREVAIMPVLSSACDIIRVSLEQKADLLDTAKIYFEIGEKFHIGWLRQQARFIGATDHWQAEAVSGLIDQLYGCQAGITIRILKDTANKAAKGKSAAQTWLAQHEQQVKQIEPVFESLRGAGTIDLAMLIIAEQRLRNLSGI